MKKCSNCGFENDDNARFCSQCGAALSEKNTNIEDDIGEDHESDSDNKYIQHSENIEEDQDHNEDQDYDIDKADDSAEKSDEEHEADAGNEKAAAVSGESEKPVTVDEEERTNDSAEQNESTEPGNRKKKLIPKVVGICVAAIIVICVTAVLSMPRLKSIEASYEGDTKEGTVLDSDNDGFIVKGEYSDGKSKTITGWEIEKPKTLKADSTSKVKISYHGNETSVKVKCSTSNVESISAYYDGDTEAGTVIDEDNDGIQVNAEYKNGSVETVKSGWTVEDPCTLEADKSYTVSVEYKGFTADIDITCSTSELTGIEARYSGGTEEGVVLGDDNKGITVVANYKNGSEEEVSGWTIAKEKELKAGKTSKVKISYEGQTCTLEVVCSTMSEDQYKAKCSSISYKDLARDPSGNKGKYYKLTGKVFQVINGDYYIGLMVNVTKSSYGTYDDSVFVYYSYKDGENKILEDDIVTIYGQSFGDYDYTTVMGASRTIPGISAEYIDVQ